jgi:hypothetical protein
VLGKRVLKRIFGLKSEYVTTGGRDLYNEQLCNFPAVDYVNLLGY